MTHQRWMDRMQPLFTQRFNELANKARHEKMFQSASEKQDEIMERIKSELPHDQFQLFLQWEDAANYRMGLEKEWMYMEGLKDGIRLLHRIHHVAES